MTKEVTSMEISSEIIKKVEVEYESIKPILNHRHKSWEHCYKFFKNMKDKKRDDKDIDLAQLHLAFYLASWGMYRGSSFILQKDYTIFKEIVKEILSKKYSLLWDIEDNLDKKKQLNMLFMTLYNELESFLKKIKVSVRDHPDLKGNQRRYLNEKEEISSTLITKIILGTIGCIPAYDRYIMQGLEREKLQKRFNPKKSFIQMIEFYTKNKEKLDSLRKKFKGYPLMKILDMYFWVAGYEGIK